jgi:hypothetical protein
MIVEVSRFFFREPLHFTQKRQISKPLPALQGDQEYLIRYSILAGSEGGAVHFQRLSINLSNVTVVHCRISRCMEQMDAKVYGFETMTIFSSSEAGTGAGIRVSVTGERVL